MRGDIARHLEQNPRARQLTVYYSGHGTQDPTLPEDDQGILLGADAEVGSETLYGVRTAEIIDNLATLAVETDVEITLILEACFNGQTGSGEPINAEISGSLSDELGRKQAAGITVISASSKTQPAYWQTAEESEEPLSRFTDAFLDALYGYGGGLDDGELTMSEALALTNSIMQRSSNEQVATVAGFNPENQVLREGRFVDRLATQFVCDDEARTLKRLSESCTIEDIEAQLDRQQCRYPSQTPGYSEALLVAEDRYYTNQSRHTPCTAP